MHRASAGWTKAQLRIVDVQFPRVRSQIDAPNRGHVAVNVINPADQRRVSTSLPRIWQRRMKAQAFGPRLRRRDSSAVEIMQCNGCAPDRLRCFLGVLLIGRLLGVSRSLAGLRSEP